MIAPRPPRRPKPARLSRAITPPSPSPGRTAAPHVVARLVPLDPGFYAFSLATETAWREPLAGLALPAVQLCAAPREDGAVEITDSFGRAGSWLGGRHNVLFVKSPAGGVGRGVTRSWMPSSASCSIAERQGAPLRVGPAVAPD